MPLFSTISVSPHRTVFDPLFLIVCRTMLAILAPLLTACAGNDTRPYPYFEHLQVVSAATPVENPTALSTGAGATSGAISGAASDAGAVLIISLMCGPWYAECAAAMLPDLMASGAAGGAVIHGLAGMSAQEAEQVNAYFQSLPKRHDLNGELVAAVTALVPRDRLTSTNADARLTVGVGAMEIVQQPDSMFFLKLKVVAELERQRFAEDADSTRRVFECVTDTLAVGTWLADDSRRLDEEISRCINSIAGQINTAIAGEPKPAS